MVALVPKHGFLGICVYFRRCGLRELIVDIGVR